MFHCSFLFYCFLSAKLAKISINGAKKVFQCVSVYENNIKMIQNIRG